MNSQHAQQRFSTIAGYLGSVIGLVGLLALFQLAAIPAWAGQPALPAGVPDIYDPEVRAHFQPVRVANFRGNPDFPVALLVNITGEHPQALLFGLDARNGKDTWSLTTDPIILIAVFFDETTIPGVYVDTGFVGIGWASGTYAAVDEGNPTALPELLKALAEVMTRTSI